MKQLELSQPEYEWLRHLLFFWLEANAWGGNARVQAEAILAKLDNEKGPEAEASEPRCICGFAISRCCESICSC